MRKLFVSLGLGLGAIASISNAAEEKKAADATPASEAARIVDMRMGLMKERLKLTPEQAEKMRAIMLRDQEKFVQMRDDSSLTPEDRNQKAREILKTSTVELQALLTPEQKEIWKAEAEKQRKAAQERQAAQGNAAPEEKK